MHTNCLIKIENASSLEDAEYRAAKVLQKYSYDSTREELFFEFKKKEIINFVLKLEVSDSSLLYYELNKENIIEKMNSALDEIGWIKFENYNMKKIRASVGDYNPLNLLNIFLTDQEVEREIHSFLDEYNNEGDYEILFEEFTLNSENNNVGVKVLIEASESALWDYGSVVNTSSDQRFLTCSGYFLSNQAPDDSTFEGLIYESGRCTRNLDLFLDDESETTYYIVCDIHV